MRVIITVAIYSPHEGSVHGTNLVGQTFSFRETVELVVYTLTTSMHVLLLQVDATQSL